MRFLQLATSTNIPSTPDPVQWAKIRSTIAAGIANGSILATGGLGQRATAAARVVQKDGQVTVEDPPEGADWMAAGGFTLVEFASKDEAIANARERLAVMGDGAIELIEVGPMFPLPRPPQGPGGVSMAGVIPYINVEGANAAAAFYQLAFGAREVHRMPAEDGVRLLHCHLEINGGSLMVSDTFPEYGYDLQPSHSFTMQLVVADVDRWWNRAVQAGCTIKQPLELAFWGDKYGTLVDPYGIHWAMSQPAPRTDAPA